MRGRGKGLVDDAMVLEVPSMLLHLRISKLRIAQVAVEKADGLAQLEGRVLNGARLASFLRVIHRLS